MTLMTNYVTEGHDWFMRSKTNDGISVREKHCKGWQYEDELEIEKIQRRFTEKYQKVFSMSILWRILCDHILIDTYFLLCLERKVSINSVNFLLMVCSILAGRDLEVGRIQV